MRAPCVVIAILALALVASAQSPVVDATIEPSTATVGDRMTLRVRLATPEGTSVAFPDVSAEVAPLVVLSSASTTPLDENGTTVEERYYVVAAFETGALGVPQLPFVYVTDSGDSGIVWTDSLSIVVESVTPDTLAEADRAPRDIKPPVQLPRRVWPFVVVAALVVAALVLFAYLRKWWMARKREPQEVEPLEPVVPKRAAHLVALERLDALERDDPIGRGDVIGFYVRVTEILRFYIRDRFAVDAIDMTTTELGPAMEDARIESAEVGWTMGFLSSADLAKFAKLAPTPERAREDLTLAREFVERTRFLGEDAGERAQDGGTDAVEDEP